MIKNFEWLIALRLLRSKRKEGFISVVSMFSLIGIALGVATLIVVMSVMNGYHIEFVKNILGIQGHITVVSSHGGHFHNYTGFSDQVEKIKGVEFVAPIILEQGMFVSNSRAGGGVVRGIEPEKLALKPLVTESIPHEMLEDFKKGKGLLIGSALAEQLNVVTGDTIKIVTPESSSTILGSIPRTKSYKVAGIFDLGLYQYNATTIFMPLSDAQLLYKYGNTVGEIEVIANSPDKLDDIKNDITQFAGGSVRMVDWEMAQEKWLSALAVERNVMFFILTLIILVAVFNIISSLIMLVQDKSKAIAILRTMGATKGSVIKIFMISGSMIGFIGSVSGVALGTLIASNLDSIKTVLESVTGTKLFDPVIYFLTKLPSDLEISNVILVFCMSFGFSVISTIYPAYRASKLMPTEVLRYE